MEYIPETAELDGDLDDEFRKIFERFNFREAAGSEVKVVLISCSKITVFH